jgi:phosphatidyl-myo-inositol alpha-mannosyltransferase
MRIAAVCPYSVSKPGGVQAQVLGLAQAFRLLGHHVDVIAPCDDAPPPGVIGMGRSRSFRVNGSIAAMAPTPAAAARTRRALATGGYDVLHIHEPLAPSITIPALLAHRAPVIGTFHAAGDRTPYRWCGRRLSVLAQQIDVRVAVSCSAAALVDRYLGGRCEVLFNGIDTTTYPTTSTTPRAGRNIMFLGRHEPRKGLEVLLRSMASLPDDVVLWVAGDGPEQARLRATFDRDERIRWLGRITEADKINRLQHASIVCVPALYGESFGVVILEATAAGTPVVASDLPGHRALTADGTSAVLVAPNDPLALANALIGLLGDHRRADELRTQGLARADAFTLQALASRYIDIFGRYQARRRCSVTTCIACSSAGRSVGSSSGSVVTSRPDRRFGI